MRSEGGGSDNAAESHDDELVGRAIGKYTLSRVIGRGGMGVVYEAQNTAIGKRVAIKMVGADLAKNKDAVRRFQREAQAASAVESAHIVDIFDAGTSDDGVPYIVMELLRGEDLGHRIKRLGRLDLGDALHVTVQILRGLARAHAAGIVHRDLKPDNVFLVDRDDDSAFVKILDFGISKVARQGETPVQTLTKQGTVLGTPFYMSPEQAQGLPDTDGRADLWSVGAIVYECLSGRAPHTGASYEQVIVNICSKDAADIRAHNPGVPEPMARVISKALARDREDRFANARDFLDAIVGASGGAVSLPPRSSDEPSPPIGSGRSVVSSPSGSGFRSGPVSWRDSGPSTTRDPVSSNSGQKAAFDETLEMKSGGPSRVGWATNGGIAVRRDRKRLLVVGLCALALGVVATVTVAMRTPDEGSGAANGPIDSGDVTIKLRANVRGTRFVVDGKQLAGGLLRGAKGETKKVLATAEGYTPVEAVVTIEPGRDPAEIVLSPTAETAGTSATGAVAIAVSATASNEPDGPALRNGPRVGGAAASGSLAPAASGSLSPKPSATPSGKPSALPTAATGVVPTSNTAAPVHTATAAPTPTLTMKLD